MDDVVPASKLYTSRRDEAIKLKREDTGPTAMKPMTIQTVFKNTLQRSRNADALGKII